MGTDSKACATCGKSSPETETNYTLISARHGWRLHRRQLANGKYDVEWHCPDCWKARKSPDSR